MSTKKVKAAKSEMKAMKKAPTKKAAATLQGKMIAVNAAAKVLAESAEPMTSKTLIDAMAAKGYWASPVGRFPRNLDDSHVVHL